MKNTITVSIWCNEEGLKKINSIPTLKNLFHANQLNSLKANTNVQMNVNHPTYSRMMNLLNMTAFNQSKTMSCTKIRTNYF